MNLRYSDKYSLIETDGSVKLVVKNATKEDAGSYNCIAESRRSNIAETIIHEVSPRTLRNAPDHCESEAKKAKAFGPSRQPISFESFLKNMTIEEGTLAKFICSIRGPFTSAIWTKDGQTVETSDRYAVGSTDGLVFLEIKNPIPNDSGVYTVSVTNGVNEMSSNAQLNVYPSYKSRMKANASEAAAASAKKGKYKSFIYSFCVLICSKFKLNRGTGNQRSFGISFSCSGSHPAGSIPST